MKKSELPVTEISYRDFLQLSLYGYARRKHYYDDKDRKIPFSQAYVKVPEEIIDGHTIPEHLHPVYKYTRVGWEQVDLVKLIKDEVEALLKDNNFLESRAICLAIHTEPTQEYIDSIKLWCNINSRTGKPLTEKQKAEDRKFEALNEYSYLDKYLTPDGAQTFIMFDNATKLYSTRDYYEDRVYGYRIPKKNTKTIYLIKF